MNLLPRVRRWFARLGERLPALSIIVEVTPFNWGLSPGWFHLEENEEGGRYWELVPTLGPVSVGVSLELPRREEGAS